MNTLEMARAAAWLSERLLDATLTDFAAMLAIGSAKHPMPVAEFTGTLGMPASWLGGFIERQTQYHGGLAPLVELQGDAAALSQIGHNVLTQYWQRATADYPTDAW